MDEWWSKSASDPAGIEADHTKFYGANIDSYEYWLSKDCWPNLQKVGLWWGELQLSSIDAERAVALGRVIDVPLRRSQSWPAFKRELAFKIHVDDMDDLLKRRLARL